MATDIITSMVGQPINNRCAIMTSFPTGKYTKVLLKPETDLTISDIESKYDDRFDDPSYYYGGGASDGGFYTGEVDVDGGEL